MSPHTLNRISHNLEKQFADRIDMSDWAGRPEADKQKAFLSRAIAALCIKSLAGVDADIAGRSVTDGYHDNGLDAVYFDQNNDVIFLVQSKWSENGTNPLDAADSNSFVAGVKDLLAARFDRFNEKIKNKQSEVKAALYSERPIQISLVTAHTATQGISPHVKRKIDDVIAELNDPVQTADGVHYDQAGIYGLITAESQPAKIKLQVGLKDWGTIQQPFLAYYGRIHISEIVQWWNDHGNALFTQNLRLFYPNSDVNDALTRTLEQHPEFFWYFNNGITIICDTIAKSPVGSPGRLVGVFNCDGASIVNGAQTVGTIGRIGSVPSPADSPETDDTEAWVQVRLISLEKCPPEFSRSITRAANLQNAVGYREFAAMDPTQHRLAIEFALDKRTYAYKQGDIEPKGDEGCGIVEATQALSCAHSATLAVQVKREIGLIWADTNAAPYTELFNDKLTSIQVWRSVLVMRAVDEELHKLRSTDAPRADLVGIHLNRMILHLVFRDAEVRALRHDNADQTKLIDAARKATHRVFNSVAAYIQENHEDDYLASLCKNSAKCEDLANELLAGGGTKQGSLFAN